MRQTRHVHEYARCALAVALLCHPGPAWAQAMPSTLGADSPASQSDTPALSVSMAVGPMEFLGRPVTFVVGALQVGLTRHLAVEAELARWVEADAPGFQSAGHGVFEIGRRETTIVGGNLLLRAGTARVVGFVGGGAGMHFTRALFDSPVNPITGVPIGGAAVVTSDVLPGLQGVGGVEVAVARRVAAFANLRAEIQPEPNVGFMGGVRFVLRDAAGPTRATSPAVPIARREQAVGKTVNVLRLDDRRVSGRLQSFSPDEIVIATRGIDQRIQLREVRRVERPGRWARHLALASAAVFGGLAAAYCATADCGREGLSTLAIEAAVAVGAGVGIGATVNAATSDRRRIYP